MEGKDMVGLCFTAAQELFVQFDHLAANGPLQKVTGYTSHIRNNLTSAIKTKFFK